MAGTFGSSRFFFSQILLFLCAFFFSGDLRSCISGSFEFDIHHRYSDAVNKILDPEGLPEIHSPGYYAAMAHRDRLVHGRRLATTDGQTPLTFFFGNDTYRLSSLGFLYYANVSVGTPSSSYLVALDTGSDLFWLPCECSSCPTFLNTSNGGQVRLNHYSPNASKTSKSVPCSSPLCDAGRQCSSQSNTCPYQINYLSENTSSSGYLVEDVLHLLTDDSNLKPVDANITLGCGKLQTGAFEEAAAPNGLLGLGMRRISVPSFLAAQNLTSDSFSMCFGTDGVGRIHFGDSGNSNQSQTPFNTLFSPSYNVSFTRINVGGNVSDVEFGAIFDSGTSFTYLNDPVYSLIAKEFDARMKLERFVFEDDFPFEFCYQLPPPGTTFLRPVLKFTMKGGAIYDTLSPTVLVVAGNQSRFICLGIIKSTDKIDLIGQNFMTGYRIIFNRDKMVLGWTKADCYASGSSAPQSPPSKAPPPAAPSPDTTPAPKISPAPGATNSSLPRAGDTGGAMRLNPITCVFTVVLAILVVL